MIVSETYTIVDNIRIGFNGITWSDSTNITQTSTQLSFTAKRSSPYTPIIFQAEKWEASFTFSFSQKPSLRFGLQSENRTGTERSGVWVRSDVTGFVRAEHSINNSTAIVGVGQQSVGNSYSANYKFKCIDGTTVQIYRENTLIGTVSNFDWLDDNIIFGLQSWDTYGNVTISNLKIKPL